MIVEKIAAWLLYPLCLLRYFICDAVVPTSCKCVRCIFYPFEVCCECLGYTLDALEHSCCYIFVLPLLLIRDFWRYVLLPSLRAVRDCMCIPCVLTRRFCKRTVRPLIRTWFRCVFFPCELLLRCVLSPCRAWRHLRGGKMIPYRRRPRPYDEACVKLWFPCCLFRKWLRALCDDCNKKFFYWFLFPSGSPRIPSSPSSLSRKVFSS
ncbi:ORF-154 [Teiidae poxvirus 1]|nr:ORF-1 [Teiidae poxvirus 1]QRY19024.1 ORF-154 [Teiidae poxvirus 1]